MPHRVDFRVRCYYGRHSNIINGTLAIETTHRGEHSKDCEVAAGMSRRDIGRVDVLDLRYPDARWVTVFREGT
jgi:hypothetical protein